LVLQTFSQFTFTSYKAGGYFYRRGGSSDFHAVYITLQPFFFFLVFPFFELPATFLILGSGGCWMSCSRPGILFFRGEEPQFHPRGLVVFFFNSLAFPHRVGITTNQGLSLWFNGCLLSSGAISLLFHPPLLSPQPIGSPPSRVAQSCPSGF